MLLEFWNARTMFRTMIKMMKDGPDVMRRRSPRSAFLSLSQHLPLLAAAAKGRTAGCAGARALTALAGLEANTDQGKQRRWRAWWRVFSGDFVHPRVVGRIRRLRHLRHHAGEKQYNVTMLCQSFRRKMAVPKFDFHIVSVREQPKTGGGATRLAPLRHLDRVPASHEVAYEPHIELLSDAVADEGSGAPHEIFREEAGEPGAPCDSQLDGHETTDTRVRGSQETKKCQWGGAVRRKCHVVGSPRNSQTEARLRNGEIRELHERTDTGPVLFEESGAEATGRVPGGGKQRGMGVRGGNADVAAAGVWCASACGRRSLLMREWCLGGRRGTSRAK